MTPEQVARIEAIRPRQLHAIPDGSWLVVDRKDGRLWLEVLDPKATSLLAWDLDDGPRR